MVPCRHCLWYDRIPVLDLKMKLWVAWILLIAASFAGLEWYALAYGTIPTLSRVIWILTFAWPPLPFVIGFVVGFLACHFWWGGITSFRPVQKKTSLHDPRPHP